MRRLVLVALAFGFAAPAAHAGVNPQIAGLQVALRAHGLYLSQIDGIAGPKTAAALRAFEVQHGLRVGPADARVRRALGPLGGPLFGARILRRHDFGWDVAVLQFLLTRRGVYTGALDGYLGPQTARALRRYQRSMNLAADAVVGPRTLSAIVRQDHVPVRAVPVRAVVTATYVVRAGDNLTAIARAHGVTLRALVAANHLDPANPIVPGQHLRVPTATSEALAPQRGDVRAMLDAWAVRLGLDVHLVRALAWMESGFQTRIVSASGARGVLQTLPSTRVYVERVLAGRPIARTVDGDIEVGLLYLRHLLQAFNGDKRLALAGWYQGERAVREHGLYKVTKPFVANVLALEQRM